MATPGTFVAGTPLTAAEMNLLPGGRMASASRSTDVNGIINGGAVTGLSVTFTAVAGRRYKISVTVNGGNQNGAGTTAVFLRQNTVTVQEMQFARAAGATPTGLSMFTEQVPGAGSVTYDVILGVSATSFDVFAGTSRPARILVEDIGV